MNALTPGPTTSLGGSSHRGAGYPIGSPFGSTSGSLSSQVTGPVSRTSDPNDAPLRGRVAPAATASTRSSRSTAIQQTTKRVGRRQLVKLGRAISDRDWLILDHVAQHGYLTTDQIQRFAFTDHASPDTALRTTRRVLNRLERDGLMASLPRRQGGVLGGSAPVTWRLAPAGSRLLTGPPGTTRPGRTPSIRHLLHCLAIAEAHLALLDYTESGGRATVDVQIEPAAWRTFAGIGGAGHTLKPDLWARITGRDGQGLYRDEYFCEIDLGTESLPTLLKKCQTYADYYRSGAWLTTRTSAGEVIEGSEGVMPRVLWILDDPHRTDQLQRAITAAIRRGDLPAELFVCTELDRLTEALDPPSDQEPAPNTSTNTRGGRL